MFCLALLELESQVVMSLPLWVLRTKLGLATRAASALKPQVISPAPIFSLKEVMLSLFKAFTSFPQLWREIQPYAPQSIVEPMPTFPTFAPVPSCLIGHAISPTPAMLLPL